MAISRKAISALVLVTCGLHSTYALGCTAEEIERYQYRSSPKILWKCKLDNAKEIECSYQNKSIIFTYNAEKEIFIGRNKINLRRKKIRNERLYELNLNEDCSFDNGISKYYGNDGNIQDKDEFQLGWPTISETENKPIDGTAHKNKTTRGKKIDDLQPTIDNLLINSRILDKLKSLQPDDIIVFPEYDYKSCIARVSAGVKGTSYDFSEEICGDSRRDFNANYKCFEVQRRAQSRRLYDQQPEVIKVITAYTSTLNLSGDQLIDFVNYQLGKPSDQLAFLFLRSINPTVESVKVKFDDEQKLIESSFVDLNDNLQSLKKKIGTLHMIVQLFGVDICYSGVDSK